MISEQIDRSIKPSSRVASVDTGCQTNINPAMMDRASRIIDNVLLHLPPADSSAHRMPCDWRLPCQFGADPSFLVAGDDSPDFPM
jgi:hypothetical protein